MSTSTIMTGYCPVCQRNVLLKREKLDFCIALMLLIFTAGIGLIYYYFAREKNRCIHCGSRCQFQIPETLKGLSHGNNGNIKGMRANHCPFCGVELDNYDNKTCPNCGSQI